MLPERTRLKVIRADSVMQLPALAGVKNLPSRCSRRYIPASRTPGWCAG